MREALKQAKLACDASEIPVGAVIVCKNRIIAKAYNQVELLKDPTGHAEMLAITAACNYLGSKYLPECTLYVSLEPCVMCAGAISWAQLGALCFAASDPKRGFRVYNSGLLHPKTKLLDQILEQESEEIIKAFFKDLRE